MMYQIGDQTPVKLVETYLGWKLSSYGNWNTFLMMYKSHRNHHRHRLVELSCQTGKNKILLEVQQHFSITDFPKNFFEEAEKTGADKWDRFALVSLCDNPEERFLIPLH